MFLSKLLVYGLITGGIFTASTFSTVLIAKNHNNNSNQTSQVEDEATSEEDYPVYQLTDTEKFINNLTTFGNMEASLNLDIKYNDKSFNVDGTVFVSMETLENIMFSADLKVYLGFMELDVKASYINETIYLSINDNNIKLKTNNITDILLMYASELISLHVEDYIPSSLLSIDTSTLLGNLAAMTSEKGEDKITYTCHLIEGFPPIKFVSDLNYKMTSLSMSGVELMGATIDLSATTNILGMGQNKITVPETEVNPYKDIKDYYPLLRKLKGLVNYGINLDESTLNAVINQIKDIVNNKKLGLDYSFNVNRNNQLVFDIDGEVNASFIDLEDLDTLKVNFTGHMSNEADESRTQILDTHVSASLVGGTAYFNYNNKLKVAYELNDIKDLISLIKNQFAGSLSINDLLDKFLPDNSTSKCPLFTLIKESNYFDLLNYLTNTKKEDNLLIISLDASILGDATGELLIKLDLNEDGIKEIKFDNIYAFGYTINASLKLKDYTDFNVNDASSYTSLKYINNLFDNIIELTKHDKFNLSLLGKVNMDDTVIEFNGDSYFEIGNNNDFGVADLKIKMNGKTHNIKLDVDRVKPNKDNDGNISKEDRDAANSKSNVLFTYNDGLKGKFTIKSLSDTFNLITTLAEKGNPLLDRFQALLTADISESTIIKVLNGDIEAILYDNLLESISYKDNSYVIELNGSFLKKNETDVISPIYLSINLDNEHKLSGISFKGSLNGMGVDITIGISKANNNNLFRLSKTDTYFDFSSMDVLINYLFTTSEQKDFTLSSTLGVAAGLIDIEKPLKAKVFIRDGNTYAHVSIEKAGLSIFSNPTFNMYFTDEEIFLERKGNTKHLTMEAFMAKPLYYILNFGFDISIYDFSEIDTNKDMKLEKIIKSYSFSNTSNTATWNITLNSKELTSSSALSDIIIKITGNNKTSLLSTINVSMTALSIVDIYLDASLDSVAPISSSDQSNILNYINKHKNDTLITA